MTDGRTGLPVTRALALIDALQARKTASDEVDARAQEMIGAPHHRILLMQDRWNSQKPRGEKRRHRWISAKPNHRARLDAIEFHRRGRESRAQGQRGARLGEGAGRCCRRRRKGVNGPRRKIRAELERPAIGRELDFGAPLGERGGQRSGGKEMSARAARREQNGARGTHPSDAAGWSRSAAGRLRVVAMRKPMPRPSASREEPP